MKTALLPDLFYAGIHNIPLFGAFQTLSTYFKMVNEETWHNMSLCLFRTGPSFPHYRDINGDICSRQKETRA